MKVVFFVAVVVLLMVSNCVHADELPDAPVAKTIKVKKPVRYSFFHLDKSVAIWMGIQNSAEFVDGISTYKFVHSTPPCITCQEDDPISRFLLGPRPGWGRMVSYGSLEALGSAIVAQKLRHASWKPFRVASYLIQPSLTSVHLVEGIHNFYLSTNDCSYYGPNFVDNGHFCAEKSQVANFSRKR